MTSYGLIYGYRLANIVILLDWLLLYILSNVYLRSLPLDTNEPLSPPFSFTSNEDCFCRLSSNFLNGSIEGFEGSPRPLLNPILSENTFPSNDDLSA